MLDYVDAYFLSIASTTPLPNDDGNATNDLIANPQPYTRSQACLPVPVNTLLRPSSLSRVTLASRQKKRNHDSGFSIFVDTDAEEDIQSPMVKRSKTNSRLPLAVRTDCANSTPTPSPRAPDTPFPPSPADPFWNDVENYSAQPFITPPPTPAGLSPSQSPLLHHTFRRTPRTIRTRPSTMIGLLPAPRSMALYNLLGLDDWKVGAAEVRAAWRRVALDSHPDRVAEEERGSATLRMQRLNDAKDVLSDNRRRHQYHMDGKLPWIV